MGYVKFLIFADARIRTAWDDKVEEWYFSIVDVVAVLTDSQDYQQARNYWKVLKNRLRQEGNETVTKCNQLKFVAGVGIRRLTDVADQEQLFRFDSVHPLQDGEGPTSAAQWEGLFEGRALCPCSPVQG